MTVALELSPDAEERLRAGASKAGVSLTEYVQHLVEMAPFVENLKTRLSPGIGKSSDDIIAEALAGIPPEDLEKLPEDLADQHDHYIHGTPRASR